MVVTLADIEQTFFLYDQGHIALQFDKTDTGAVPANALSHRYLWGPAVDMLLADEQVDWSDTDADGEVLWALADHLGSVRDAVDSTGQVRFHREFDAYGNVVDQVHYDESGDPVSSGPEFVTVDFGYTGKFFDESTGLQQNWHRWYDPAVGRWVSQDYIWDGTNKYGYVGNGPVDSIDPTGLVEPDSQFFYGVFIEPGVNMHIAIHRAAADARSIAWKDWEQNGNVFALLIGYPYACGGELIAHGAFGVVEAVTLGQAGRIAPMPQIRFGRPQIRILPVTEPPVIKPPTLRPITVVNEIPSRFARVVPGHLDPKTLGVTERIFVTNAESIRGLNAPQLAECLEIDPAPFFKIIEFSSSNVQGVATPLRSDNPLFVGGGLTSGGKPEWTIPNGPLPLDAVIMEVP